MTRKRFIYTLACLLSLVSIQPAHALFIREYTEERPLIIASDWEFPPYEFRNDRGLPDGYNIEVLELVLNNLKIPHKFVMNEWYKCTEAFDKRDADLIHALSFLYKEAPYVMTQNLITYYNLRAVRQKGTPPLNRLSQLSEEDTLILKKNDYADLRVRGSNPNFNIMYRSTREALIDIRSGKYKYYIWGEIPLRTKIKEFGIDDLELDETDIPSGELRIIGYDKDLIDDIDETYARLEQAGALEEIRDKWFHPERIHNDASPISLLALLGAIAAVIIAVLMAFVIRLRVKAAIHKSLDLNQMMNQALSTGSYHVIEYNIQTKRFRNVHSNLLPEEGTDLEDYTSHVHESQLDGLFKEIQKMASGEMDKWTVKRRWNTGTAEAPDWHNLEGTAITEKSHGVVRYIIFTFQDVTEKLREERDNIETANKYRKMFDTNLIGMSFYDKNGMLLDLNENMKLLTGYDQGGEKFFKETNMFDIPLLKGVIEPKNRNDVHFCQTMHYPDLGIHKYIEVRLLPVLDDNGELIYYVYTARDMTTERNMYMELRRHEREIKSTDEAISEYENQLKYLLENSNMYVWNFDLSTRLITFSRSLNGEGISMSRDEYMGSLVEEEREGADKNLMEVMMQGKAFNAVHHFHYTPINPEPSWYALSGIPSYDKQGHSTGYIGIARNITDLMEAQRKLKEETERAENSGKMKSAFLANMTHEIRTPLNAIVGFSDLLPVVDTQEERMEFIRIIRNNCDMLMRLINDILEASNMGQALAIKHRDVDFAIAFDDMCQTLAQRVQEAGVEFIKDNPYRLYQTSVDIGRVQQILTNFVTNAVKYTHEGHIKVGYRYEKRSPRDGSAPADGLYFYCEDTGAGISKENQPKVFERFVKLNDFVQGTGLGLSICQAIVERGNGFIGVSSEGEGHGSTFWFWAPIGRREYAEK